MSETKRGISHQSRLMDVKPRRTTENGESSLVTWISQSDTSTRLETETFNIGGRDVQNNGNRKDRALVLTIML